MKRLLSAVAAVAAIVAGGACGDGGTGSSTATATTTAPEDAMLTFARCMREHGIEMQDPDSSGNFIAVVGEDADPGGETFREAHEACKDLAPPLRNVSREDAAEMEDKLRAMARCMRSKGHDMPDPVIASAEGSGPAGASGATRIDPEDLPFDPDDPAFQRDQRECSKKAGVEMPASGGIVGLRSRG